MAVARTACGADASGPGRKQPGELAMSRDQAKRLGRFRRRKKDTDDHVFVLCDNGARLALSLAFALCHTLRLCRKVAIYQVGDEDWRVGDNDLVPSRHVYEIARAGRAMVV
jgi:hypothetical protein